MKQVVYIDVLVFLNIIITFLLLSASSRLTKASPPPGRYVFGGLLGGAFSLIILAPEMGLLVSLAVKIVVSLIIVVAVYNPKTVKSALRFWGYFFCVNFIFAGIMLFISSIIPHGLVSFSNGVVYVDFSFASLVASSLVCYAVICVLNKITCRRSVDRREYSIVLENGGRRVKGTALLDTGNSLTDPFTGESVIIADREFASDILPNNIRSYLSGDVAGCCGIKLIPCSGVSDSGMLVCFRCDNAVIGDGKDSFSLKKPQVAVASQRLRGCSVLIDSEIIANNERGNKVVHASESENIVRQ